MKTEKQLKQLEEARRHIRNRACSEETKRKISMANDGNFLLFAIIVVKSIIRKSRIIKSEKDIFVVGIAMQNIEGKFCQKKNKTHMEQGCHKKKETKEKRRVLSSITICATRKFNDSLVKCAVMKTRKPSITTTISLWKLDGYVGIVIENGIKNTIILNFWR